MNSELIFRVFLEAFLKPWPLEECSKMEGIEAFFKPRSLVELSKMAGNATFDIHCASEKGFVDTLYVQLQ